MTATEKLIMLLDERGIAWETPEERWNADSITYWKVGDIKWVAFESENDTLWLNCNSITDVTPEQAIAATVGRSCASCPEMDNPDSYIVHLQSALRWHDEHVPRPTNPKATCVVLKGEKPPEEVLFVHDEGGVTHYLPEDAGTCKNVSTTGNFRCSECDAVDLDFDKPTYCHGCGKKVVSE